ncbi:Phosphate-binding protein PstS precursor [Rubripirellula amarantea]|uniref:Phosphate-binding protein n=1 Tax=Rubripirellula amarantea TaxID=2527999 RepID=A0A5C5WYX8_9BACT|nr:PstS family phosphate ABC transporter substrate-binding protein [Rubripirellula amarantea]TWT55112.1 Phosphate-binding protein PstS precursor [Rubripirellula amarantea]
MYRIFGTTALLLATLTFVGCEPTATPSVDTSTDLGTSTADSSSSNTTATAQMPAANGEAPSATVAAGDGKVNTELQGKIEIDGSSTVFPISEAAANQFGKRFPNVNVTVGVSGTGGGFKRFTKGETDISDASRPIKGGEFDAAKASGVSFVEIPVAYDGLTIVVHKDNDWVDHLTVDEIKKIFNAEPAAKSWSAVRDGWPDKEIKIFAPGTDSGTFDYFMEVVAGKSGSLRSDMSTSEDDNVLVTGVSGSPSAIGFFGVAYYEENKDKLKAVPVVNPELGEPIAPTSETIESGDYAPFSRPLFIYVNVKSLSRPEVKRFVTYYVENAPAMAQQTGYVALPADVYQTALKNARARKAGTHYLTAEGDKREGPVTKVFQASNLNTGK